MDISRQLEGFLDFGGSVTSRWAWRRWSSPGVPILHNFGRCLSLVKAQGARSKFTISAVSHERGRPSVGPTLTSFESNRRIAGTATAPTAKRCARSHAIYPNVRKSLRRFFRLCPALSGLCRTDLRSSQSRSKERLLAVSVGVDAQSLRWYFSQRSG
jgi:hypothetical protein